MDQQPSIALESLASLSVAKCLQRISRVSAGTWQVESARVSYGSVRDALKRHDFKNPATAVYIALEGASPFATAMLFDPADIACVSQCFTGHSFPHGAATAPAEEIMLTELGNIVLNALLNTLLNAVKKSHFPAMPRYDEGGLDTIAAEFTRIPQLNQDFRIITVTIDMRCDKTSARSEVFALVPEELAMELENLRPPAGHHDAGV